jgi:uncharacterized protein YgiB involved in biofilm formation
MKRSASLRLVLMGGAALTLSACDESVEVGVFQTVEQCEVMGYSKSACETAIAAAQKEHLQSAPRYATKADCEAEFGRCEAPPQTASNNPPGSGQNPNQPPGQNPGQMAQSQGGGFGSFFMPMMAGYMIGNMMGNRGAMAQPLYSPVGDAARQAGGTGFYTGNGTRVAGGAGLTRMPESALNASRAPTTTLSRGGFGARAQSVSVAS